MSCHIIHFRLVGYTIKLGEQALAGIKHHIYFSGYFIRFQVERGNTRGQLSGLRTVGETFLKCVRPFLLIAAESINIKTSNAVLIVFGYAVAGHRATLRCALYQNQLVLQ